MPLFKIKETDLVLGDTLEEVVHKVFALMFYPGDGEARATYIASFGVDRAHRLAERLGPDFRVNVQYFRRVYLSDPAVLADKALEPAVRTPAKVGEGFEISGPGVAGNILLQALAFRSAGHSDISLTRCIAEQSQGYREKGASLGSTERALKDLWHKYRSISHIVAAFIAFDRKSSDDGAWMHDPFLFMNFLRLANTMMSVGEKIGDRRAREPILHPGEGWEFVIAPCALLSRTGSKFSGPGRKF